MTRHLNHDHHIIGSPIDPPTSKQDFQLVKDWLFVHISVQRNDDRTSDPTLTLTIGIISGAHSLTRVSIWFTVENRDIYVVNF